MANAGAWPPAPRPVRPAPGAAGPAPDISRMTPRERFDRLFNRVMQAAEQGDTAQVERFTPMALGAYAQLDSVNADARYHAAVLRLQVGDLAGALALARHHPRAVARPPVRIHRARHRRRLSGRHRRSPGARRASSCPTTSAERAADRIEYREHEPAIEDFKQQRRRAPPHDPHHPRRPQPRLRRRVHVLRPREGKIDTGDLRYVHELSDIESLNQRARRAELEVTAVSIHAYAYLWRDYALLGSGSSMGDGYGPRLVATRPRPADPRAALRRAPGRRSRASSPPPCLALKLYQPDVVEVVIPFDQIEDAVHRGEVDVGLLIHEGQLTYADTGLQLWADLGAWWLEETGLPLPLGGNAVRRDLGRAVIDQIARDLRASIVYALEHRAPALAHAKQFNRGIGDERTDTFVGMYVNDWTVDYGPRGRAGRADVARSGPRGRADSRAGGRSSSSGD